MGAAAGFDVDVLNVHYSDSVARDDTTLVEVEAVLLFCCFFVLKVFGNRMTLEYDFIRLILYFHLLLLGNGLIMRNINMRIVLGLFRPMLPNMWSKNSPRSSINNMCASMEASQRISSLLINFANNL